VPYTPCISYILYLITLWISGEQYKIWSSSFCNFHCYKTCFIRIVVQSPLRLRCRPTLTPPSFPFKKWNTMKHRAGITTWQYAPSGRYLDGDGLHGKWGILSKEWVLESYREPFPYVPGALRFSENLGRFLIPEPCFFDTWQDSLREVAIGRPPPPQHTTIQKDEDKHPVLSGIRTHDPSNQATNTHALDRAANAIGFGKCWATQN
jgi:hypothetical protein